MWESIWRFLVSNPGLTIIGAVTLIQIAPIKIDPWSAALGWVRKTILGGIDTKLDNIARKVDALEEQAKEDKALQARTEILRFADEVYQQERHSKEFFDEVLQAIDHYEKYCNEHPGFKNNRTVMSAARIREIYAHLMETHGFL